MPTNQAPEILFSNSQADLRDRIKKINPEILKAKLHLDHPSEAGEPTGYWDLFNNFAQGFNNYGNADLVFSSNPAKEEDQNVEEIDQFPGT